MMRVPAFIPKPTELARETLIVIGGAILAAAIVGAMPTVREWIKRQWDGAPRI